MKESKEPVIVEKEVIKEMEVIKEVFKDKIVEVQDQALVDQVSKLT